MREANRRRQSTQYRGALMSAESALYAALSGLPGLTALVSTRIYPDVIPGCSHASRRHRSHRHRAGDRIGGAKFGEFAMTISAWAPTRTLAESVGDQIAEALRVVKPAIRPAIASADMTRKRTVRRNARNHVVPGRPDAAPFLQHQRPGGHF